MVTTADALPLIADDTWSITEITYAFPTDVSNYPSDYGLLGELDSFAAMPGSAVPLFEAAFRNYAEVINMDFRPAETGETAVIDIASSTAGNFAWAYFPSTSREGGDMWFNTNAHNFGPLVSPPTNFHGIYVYHTILHELGHAMGLLHGHDVLPSDVDGMENSVMTYRSYVGDPIAAGYNNIAGHFSQSLMRLDIAAVTGSGCRWPPQIYRPSAPCDVPGCLPTWSGGRKSI